MSKLRVWLTLAAIAIATFSGRAWAQKTDGIITGQVTDTSDAAVPNASVSISNKESGLNRTVKTNQQGEYTFDSVPVGKYDLQVQTANFKVYKAEGVTVNVATTTRLDAQLSVGNVSEVVTVSAEAVQVQTDSGSLGNVIDGTQVKELPLNGRSFVELTQLGPGVSAANNFDSKNKGLQGGVDFSVNGNPTTNNLFLVDGANDNDVGSNRTILIYPSIESIAEFKMLTNSYGPEYGQASGAVISIVTRSGTNAFHGSAFYSGRNDALAAYTYFARRNAGKGQPLNGKDKLRRNDWGYSIGGPVKRDKLFFFFSEEWNHEIRGFTQSACVATPAELAGDFSNPSCGAASPVIPAAYQQPGNPKALANVDPTGSLLAEYYPLPNQTTPINGNNWSQSLPTSLQWRQENVRGDFNLNSHNTIMGRYTQDTWTNPAYNGNQYWGDTPYPEINGNWAQPSKMAIGRWTSTITNTLVNDAEFAYSNNRINITPGGFNAGLANQLAQAIPTLYPIDLKTNQGGATPTIWGGLGAYGGQNIWSIAPWNNTLDIYTVRDDVSKVAGRHAIKTGLFLGFDGKNEDTGPASSERPSFTTDNGGVNSAGVRTGNQLANLLVPGNIFNLSETSTNVRAQLRWRDYEFYGGDTWKLSPRLTINYGLRYSILPTPYQPDGLETNFVPALYDPTKPASDACNGLIVVPGKDPCGDANKRFGTNFSSGTAGPNKYLQDQNYHQIAPRIGIAWDVAGDGKTAVRAGFGQFYQRERVSRYQLVANAPFALSTPNSIPRALGAQTSGNLSGSGSPSGAYDLSNTVPTSYQWNLTVEQQLAKDTALQVSYVGNRGLHLTSSTDINAIQPANWLAATFTSNQAPLRPYSHDGAIATFTHSGDSYYHGLQTLFRTQIGPAFRLQAAYTWSHAIADVLTDDSGGSTGAQSFLYGAIPRLDRGNSATNRPNIFVANGTYLAPKLQNHGELVQQTLGGWELTGITSADSGNSFSKYQNGLGETTGNLIDPNAVGAGALNSLFQTGLVQMQRPLLAQGQSCSNGSQVHNEQILNPDAFTLIGYHLGTYEPSMAPRGACHGPKLINTDLSIDKNWRVKERFTVQFRFDAFDIFNHANFRADQLNGQNPIQSVNCGAAVNGLYQPCSPTNNVVTSELKNTLYGQSTGLVGNAERQFQYGLHIEF